MDLHNRLGDDDEKSFDDSDASSLIKIFNKGLNSYIVCFHVFEVDVNGYLVTLFLA